MLDTFDTEFPPVTEVTEALTCEENLADPIQGRSEEENEGQYNNTIDSEKNNSDADLQDIKVLLEKLIKGEIFTDSIASSGITEDFPSLCRTKSKISSESRTAKIWFSFLEMIDILHSFVKAERI